MIRLLALCGLLAATTTGCASPAPSPYQYPSVISKERLAADLVAWGATDQQVFTYGTLLAQGMTYAQVDAIAAADYRARQAQAAEAPAMPVALPPPPSSMVCLTPIIPDVLGQISGSVLLSCQ